MLDMYSWMRDNTNTNFTEIVYVAMGGFDDGGTKLLLKTKLYK
jgi:hypothetical protein